MDESALIRAAQGGDSRAFEQLLDERYSTIYRFAHKWCGNTCDAEDVAQQACIKIARNLKQFNHESKFSTWLYRLVINCAKDWQRQQQRHISDGPSFDDSEEVSKHVEDKTDIAVYLSQLLAWVELLGSEFKETLLLVFGEGLSHSEAAKVLNVKESTVSWRIHNVRNKLTEFEKDERGHL